MVGNWRTGTALFSSPLLLAGPIQWICPSASSSAAHSICSHVLRVFVLSMHAQPLLGWQKSLPQVKRLCLFRWLAAIWHLCMFSLRMDWGKWWASGMARDDLADVLQLFCSQEVAGAAQPSSPCRGCKFKKKCIWGTPWGVQGFCFFTISNCK